MPGPPFEFRHQVVCADGRRLDLLHRGMLSARPGPEASGVALLQDITAQHLVERRLQARASQDKVTGFAWLVDIDLPDRAQALRQRSLAVQALLQAPVRLGPTDVLPLCRIGVGRYPVDADSPAGLLAAAGRG